MISWSDYIWTCSDTTYQRVNYIILCNQNYCWFRYSPCMHILLWPSFNKQNLKKWPHLQLEIDNISAVWFALLKSFQCSFWFILFRDVENKRHGSLKRKIATGIMSCTVWMEMDLKWARRPHSADVQSKTLGEYFNGIYFEYPVFWIWWAHSLFQQPLSLSTSTTKPCIAIYYVIFWKL